MRDALIVINSFFHDMATGVWLAVLFIMHVVSVRATMIDDFPQGLAFIDSIMDQLWLATVISFVVIIITGFIRALTFRYYGWTGDVARNRKKLLLFKHIILGIIVVSGLYLQYTLMMRV